MTNAFARFTGTPVCDTIYGFDKVKWAFRVKGQNSQ